jgi:hypothetical protein
MTLHMLLTITEVCSNYTRDMSRCNIRQSYFLLMSFPRCFIPFGTVSFPHVTTAVKVHLRLLELAQRQAQSCATCEKDKKTVNERKFPVRLSKKGCYSLL